MREKVTIFHTLNNKNKYPISPFHDNTFVFETFEVETNIQMYSVLVSHYILNIPINLDKPIRTYRRKTYLDKFYDDKITYFILDIDKVKTEEDKNKILDYFSDYKVILGESKSYNGITNFNMKGVLFIEDINLDNAKLAISSIHHDLHKFCVIDERVARKVSLNAPILKNNIFLNNEEGKRYKFSKSYAIKNINSIKNTNIKNNKNLVFDVKNLKNVNHLKDDLDKIKAQSIEKLCLEVFQLMGFTAIRNNPNGSISFMHPMEKKSPGSYFWFSSSPYTMHHPNSLKTINIFDVIYKLPQAKELLKKKLNYDKELLKFHIDTSVLQVNEKYLKVTPEIKEKIQKFLHNKDGILSIRSPMGTGKSTIIKYCIEECLEQDLKVLVITNRISVAHDFGKKYNLKVYNLDKYEIGDSLICQFDSLWKYNIKLFDVVIMDEFISLMMHSRSAPTKNPLNIIKFFSSFKKKMIIADAFLTGYENFLFDDKTHNIHMIDNIYRDPTTIYSYNNFNFFVQSLLSHADKHKCTVSATSISFINALQILLEKRGKRVVTLTASTPQSTKNLVYELFKKDDHDKWDVLIYSPTLTVGVSNLNRVHYHFHYDSSISTDVISSLQMLKRTRKSKEIHMFIKDRIKFVKTSYDEMRDEYISNIGKYAENNYLFDIDDYGEIRLSEIGKKAVKIDTFKNILEFNHKEAMFWLMKYHFMNEPRIINKKFRENVLYKYQKENLKNKRDLLISNINQFLMLNDIEKLSLLNDNNLDEANKILKVLAEIDENIKEKPHCPPDIKRKILECAIKDRNFIKKCKYFKIAFNYTKGIYDESDIKHLISKSITENKNEDLIFYNKLLSYGKCGQNKIYDEYQPKVINENPQLKYILDKCGYIMQKRKNPKIIGYRGYAIDPNIKELYRYIKDA